MMYVYIDMCKTRKNIVNKCKKRPILNDYYIIFVPVK